METEQLTETEESFCHLARTKVNRDVIVLFMLAKKYKLDLLSLLALYEIYERDVFVFFYILSGAQDSSIMGKSVEELNFGDKLHEIPKESNLKLMFTKAKKVADALRRNSDYGLTSVTLPWYNMLSEFCEKTDSGENYINFYYQIKEMKESKKESRRKSKV